MPGVTLAGHPTERTIGADLEFLRRVLNWAMTVKRPNGTMLVERNPLFRYPIPTTVNPKRPVASYDRYLALRRVAGAVDRQGLFPMFLDLVEALGWRVSAVCGLRASDLELAGTAEAPDGRILKRAETDKMGVRQWVPMAPAVRAAVAALLDRRPAIGDTYLFPAPQREGRPWTRYHALDLLRAAEVAAELPRLDGSAWHAFRRKWATERKHLPLSDVAAAGGWRNADTLLTCYTQPDPRTMLAVVSETRKVRTAT